MPSPAVYLVERSGEGVSLPAGQFSRWFSSLGINPKTPKASEEVLSRMGTAVKQSKTVGKTTVTLNAAS